MKAALPAFSSQVADALYATLDPAPRAASGLVLACAGRERCLPSYRVDRAGYACHALEFVAEGAGVLVLAGRRHRLQAGDMFAYGPGVPHRIESDSRRPLLKYFVDFFGREASALCREAGLAPPAITRVAEIEPVRQLLDELLREAQKPHALRGALATAYLRLVLLKAREPAPPAASDSSGRAYSTLLRALRIVETRHASLRSLADLAAAARVDPAHLCRLYARYRRDTPGRHILRRKLDAAARLLATEPVLVKEAAAAAGFPDPLRFSRVFHRAFGCSPSEFQARHRASIALPGPDKTPPAADESFRAQP